MSKSNVHNLLGMDRDTCLPAIHKECNKIHLKYPHNLAAPMHHTTGKNIFWT